MKYPTDSPRKSGAWLYDHGANNAPLNGKAVIPEWGKWQSERQPVEVVKGFPWDNATGVGVLHGIGGWRCLDIDDCTKFGPVQQILDELGFPHTYPWIVESGSGEGWHIWIRCPDDNAFDNKEVYTPRSGGAFDHLEVRWNRHQTAVPPSVHPDTGAVYEFAGSRPEAPPWEVEAEKVRAAVEAIGTRKRKNRSTTTRSAASADFDDPEVEDIQGALDALPDGFGADYPEWIRAIMAVKDGAPDDTTAEKLLRDWREEWDAGEYAEKLASLEGGPPDGVDPVTIGTLFGVAQDHGWNGPSAMDDPTGDAYTLDEFEADVKALDIDLPADGSQAKSALEYKVNGMSEKTAKLPPGDLEQAGAFLRAQGMRARAVRSWKSAVKETRKLQQEKAQTDSGPKTPQELEHGELTAWIAEEVLSGNAFALDRSGKLYFYRGGRYHEDGEDHLNSQIKDVLDDAGMTKEFTRYRCEEVRHRINVEAPTLWDHPPEDRINLKNGILNLNTGELEEHGPEKWLSTRQIPVKHDPAAEGTAWEECLSDWLPDDAGAEVGHELVASLLLPGFGRRKASYLYGGKSKGKSTFLRNLTEGFFGEQGIRHMTLQDLEEDPYARANLFDATLNVCADLPAKPLEGTSVFKRITGGDKMSANRKYKDRFSFTPHCRLIFSGNVPIRAPDAGEPFWDRWLVIPFNGTSYEEGDDGHVPRDELDARLQDPEELSALLNNVLAVIQKVKRSGVTETDSMAAALERIRRHPTNDLPTRGAPQSANPQGDSAPGVPVSDTSVQAPRDEGRPENPPQAGVSDPQTPNEAKTHGGEGYTQDFEKEEGSDTQGTCPRSRAFQSFERGDPVQTPTDGKGQVKELREGDPPTVIVSFESGPSKRYAPDRLTAIDEAPF